MAAKFLRSVLLEESGCWFGVAVGRVERWWPERALKEEAHVEVARITDQVKLRGCGAELAGDAGPFMSVSE